MSKKPDQKSKDEKELDSLLVHRAIENREVVTKSGEKLSGERLERHLQQLEQLQKHLQRIERRGLARKTIMSLLSEGVDAAFFADEPRVVAFARALATPTVGVASQHDDEHNATSLVIDDRSAGYARQSTIGIDFVTSPEDRALGTMIVTWRSGHCWAEAVPAMAAQPMAAASPNAILMPILLIAFLQT